MADSKKEPPDDDRTHVGFTAPVVKPPVPSRDDAASKPDVDRTTIMPVAPPVPPGGGGGDAKRVLPASLTTPSTHAGAAVAPPGEGADSTQLMQAPAPPEPAKTVAAPLAPPARSSESSTSDRLESAATAAEQSAAPPAAVVTEDGAAGFDDRTVVLRRVESTLALRRLPGPYADADTLRLDRPRLVIGRGSQADIKLFSPTSSREHVRLEERSGAWFAEAFEGKTFSIDDGVVQGEVELKVGMRLQLGDDQLVVAPAGDEAGEGEREPGKGLFSRILSWWKRLRKPTGT